MISSSKIRFVPTFEFFANLTILIVFAIVFFAASLYRVELGGRSIYCPTLLGFKDWIISLSSIVSLVLLSFVTALSAIEKMEYKQVLCMGMSIISVGLMCVTVIRAFVMVEMKIYSVSPTMYVFALLAIMVCLLGVNSKQA